MTHQALDSEAPATLLASKSDVGQVRSANEDCFGSAQRTDGARLLVVADGMGGHRGGATASQTATEAIVEIFESNGSKPADHLLRQGIETANRRIFEMARVDPDLEGMGTTVVAFVIDADLHATVAHVGDSRAYRYRRGALEPLTTDHSVVAEMQRRGLLSPQEAASHPRRNEILRSVGVLPEVEIEVSSLDVAPGDRFLLCSDGLSGVVEDLEIAAILQSKSPTEAVDALIDLANERGGPDNITVQVLSLAPSDSATDPEATAPVQLSTVGLEAIENRRRERVVTRRAAITALVLTGLAGVFLAWRFLGESRKRLPTDAPTTRAESPPDAAPTNAERPIETKGTPLDPAADAPRRGLPR